MSNRAFAALVIAVGLAAAADAQPSRYPVVDETTITRTLAMASGSGRVLEVRNITGFLHVTAGDGPNVEMSIHKTIRARGDTDKAEAERDVRLDFVEHAPRVEAIVRDRQNHICGEETRDDRDWDRVYYDVRFDFTIKVPRDVQLRLCTINARDLTVDGTRGDFDVDNVNGRIDMTGVAGSGRVHTVNGGVTVRFTANPSAATSFKTVNGNVDVYFQDGLSADLRMKTMTLPVKSSRACSSRPSICESRSVPLYRNTVLLGTTRSLRMRARLLIKLSAIPSLRYSASPPPALVNGSTAIESTCTASIASAAAATHSTPARQPPDPFPRNARRVSPSSSSRTT